MRTRDPFGQALAALRDVLSEGVAPGEHLPIADIAADLRLSTSPVREALSRLCGEGLIEDRRGSGYFVRNLPTEDIVGLFELERAYVELAVRLAEVRPPRLVAPSALEAWIEALFASCSNEPLRESYERVAGRLAPIRRMSPAPDDPSPSDGDVIQFYYEARIRTARDLASRLRHLNPGPIEYTAKTV